VHPLLARQLRALDANAGKPPSLEQWQALLEHVSCSYLEADQDRYLTERSLGVVSQEMQALYDEARRNAEALDARLRELRDTQAELVRAGKLAAVGTLVAGVAHEINNPLAFVMNNLGFVEDALARQPPAPGREDAGELRAALAEVRQGVDRVRLIVRDLKTMSRPEPEPQAPVDVHRALRSAAAFASAELGALATVVWQLGPVPPVMANEARLGQVFMNLIVNALQAMPDRPPEQNEIRVVSYAQGGQVMVEVWDNGLGIPAEHLPRLFDPFFTTKAPGKGTGLGLSVCQSIVANLGGRIGVESWPGKGSGFRVALPAAPAEQPAVGAAAPAAVVAPAPAAPPAARGRILVVDDEEPIGRSVSRLLRREHDVVCTISAHEALAALAQPLRFDVILCDLTMPGTSGIEFHAQLDRTDPALARRMVFMTGGALTATSRAFLAALPDRCLEKPCDPAGLRQIVARVMQEGRAG
jgi:signal transduction histidine kinase/CheY-like chemotaxis protein